MNTPSSRTPSLGHEVISAEAVIAVIELKPPHKGHAKSLSNRGLAIEQNYNWLLEIVLLDEFQVHLADLLRFVTASGVITRDTKIVVELREGQNFVPTVCIALFLSTNPDPDPDPDPDAGS